MGKLLVLTFADSPLSETNHLRRSCQRLGVEWKALISSPWKQNVIKLKLLFEFLQEQDPERIILVVDAYDVLLYQGEKQILDLFYQEQVDVLFSGESNFMYKEPAKWLAVLRKYPRQPTIYQYLNSGSYIGKARHLLDLLHQLQDWFSVDLTDEQKLLPIKSDQYLLSRFYVENHQNPGTLNLGIDAHQRLLGCTGGRFCVLKFPDLGKWQAFLHFILERNILKALSLHRYQKSPKDFVYQNGHFYNKKTNTQPPVMHFPGTWDRFDKVLEELSTSHPVFSKKGKWVFAAMVSAFSYVFSLMGILERLSKKH